MERIFDILNSIRRRVCSCEAPTLPNATRRLTADQRDCARRWHESMGVEGTEQLYALYLVQTEKLCAAQREVAELKSAGGGDE